MPAVAMNVATAAKDRGDKRARPQTPWPDVQPDPTAVPIPTSKPAKAIPPRLSGTVWATPPVMTPTISGATIRPPMKAARQDQSCSVVWLGNSTLIAPLVMPVIPAIRPNKTMTMIAEMPIRMPPNKEAQGVKAVATTGSMRVLQRLVARSASYIDSAVAKQRVIFSEMDLQFWFGLHAGLAGLLGPMMSG